LIQTIVNATVGKVVAPTTPTRPFFDGTSGFNPTNFLQNEPALTALDTSLYKFFGAALGCSDQSIAPYNGGAMDVVHKPLRITQQSFDFFNAAVIQVCRDAGVTAPDLVAINNTLYSLQDPIVHSICDKYSIALKISNKALIQTVVNQTVGLVVADNTPTKKFFDGTSCCNPTNFLTNAGALDALDESLYRFFGAALGCSDNSIAKYAGLAMDVVHQPLQIDSEASRFFNAQVVSVCEKAGVQTEDLNRIAAILSSLDTAIISQGPATPNQNPDTPVLGPGPNGNPNGGPNGNRAPVYPNGGQIAGIVIGCFFLAVFVLVVIPCGVYCIKKNSGSSDDYHRG